MTRLSDIGEDALIQRLIALVPLPDAAEAGPGDDCAVVDQGHDWLQLLKTDAIVGGIHFLADTSARRVGWKAAARVASDMAAMGGQPERFLITISISPDTPVDWLEDVYRGIADCLKQHQAVLVGGETCSSPMGAPPVISISATGRVLRDHLTLRSGGRPGDSILVTGRLGGSLRGHHLDFIPRLNESDWLVSNFKPTAMMDLSDGLAKDLPRLAKASGCGFRLDRASLPCNQGCSPEQALGDGEDYELLLTVDPNRESALRSAWHEAFPSTPLTRIGMLCEAGTGESLAGGWDHFG